MPNLVKVADLAQLRESSGLTVSIDGRELALFLREGKVFAVSNVCAHQHFSLLHKGRLAGKTVECPMHGWTYNLETGRAINGEGRIATFPVTIRGSDILVEIPGG